MPPQVQPTCRAMLRAVPRGRSFFGWGTTTVIAPFLNLWGDPLILTSSKPSAFGRLTMSRLLRSMRNYIHTIDVEPHWQVVRLDRDLGHPHHFADHLRVGRPRLMERDRATVWGRKPELVQGGPGRPEATWRSAREWRAMTAGCERNRGGHCQRSEVTQVAREHGEAAMAISAKPGDRVPARGVTSVWVCSCSPVGRGDVQAAGVGGPPSGGWQVLVVAASGR